MTDEPDDESPSGKTTFERVAATVLNRDEPGTAEDIAAAAGVPADTTRRHLQQLDAVDAVVADPATEPVTYHPDPGYLWYREVRAIARDHDRDELSLIADSFRGSIEQYRDLSGAETVEALRERLASGDVPDEALASHKRTAAEWESDEHRLALIEDAMQWYEVLTAGPERLRSDADPNATE